MTNTKYFFISFTGTKFVEPKKMGIPEDMISEIPDLKMINGKNKLPIHVTDNTMILSDSGMFIPSAMQQFLMIEFKLEQVKITFVKEVSKEEYEEEKKCVEMLSRDPKDRPLDFSVVNEIDNLISNTEKGNLRVIVDPKSEKPRGEFDDLYEMPDEWKDD